MLRLRPYIMYELFTINNEDDDGVTSTVTFPK